MSQLISKEFSRFHKEYIVDNHLKVIETIDIDLNQRLLDEDRFRDLTIYCDTAYITSNLKFPGKHLLINCRQLVLDKNYTIDTSVTDADLKYIDWGTPRVLNNTSDFMEEVFKQENKSSQALLSSLKANILAANKSAISFDDSKDAIQSLNQLLAEPLLYEICLTIPLYGPRLKQENPSLAALEMQTNHLRTKTAKETDTASLRLLQRFNREVIYTIEKEDCPKQIFIWCDYEKNRQAQQGNAAQELNAGYDGKKGEDGAHGANGNDGIDAGNVSIIAELIVAKNNSQLTIKANGGKGGRGQDGGNGSNGNDASQYVVSVLKSTRSLPLTNGNNKASLEIWDFFSTKKEWFFSSWELYMKNQAGFDNAVAAIIPKGGKGGNGGNAGVSGKGGNGGLVNIYCIKNTEEIKQRIVVENICGIAAERAQGGKAGKSGESSTFKLGLGDVVPNGTKASYTYFESKKGVVGATTNGIDGMPGLAGKNGEYTFSAIKYKQLFYQADQLRLISITDKDTQTGLADTAKKALAMSQSNTSPSLLLTDAPDQLPTLNASQGKQQYLSSIPTLVTPLNNYLHCSVAQRLMTLHAVKLAYLKSDISRTTELLNWLEKVTPEKDVPEDVKNALLQFVQLVSPGQPVSADQQLYLVRSGDSLSTEQNKNLYTPILKEEFSGLRKHADFLLSSTDNQGFHSVIRELKLGSAIHHQIILLKNYLACGLNFHGHALNYTPLFKVEHYTDRITKTLNIAKSVEKEFNRWSAIASDASKKLKANSEFISSANEKLQTLDLGTNELLERKQQMENTLTDLTRELKEEFKTVAQSSRDFFDEVQRAIGFEIGFGVLNVVAQTVLIATGNVAAAKYVGMASTGIDKLQGYLQDKNADVDENGQKLPAKNSFLDAASNSFSRHAASMKKLDAHQQDKKKVKQALKAEIIKKDDETNLTIAINGVKEKKPETGFIATAKSKGEQLNNVVAHVMPIAGEIQNLSKLFKDLEESRETLSFDAIKLAMTNDTYNDMLDQFEKYAGKQAVAKFKKEISKFEQLSRKRNELQLEYTALFIKMQELVAASMLVNQEIGISKEQIAINEDPVIRQMSLFWQNVYDYFRDLLLDSVYEEFQAYRYAALSDAPFSVISLSDYIAQDLSVNDDKDISDALRAARKIDQLYLNQNLTFIELLHNRVYEMAIRAREGKFGSHAVLEGEAGRIVFKQSTSNRLFVVEKGHAIGVFFITDDMAKFNNRAYLNFSELRVFLPGVQAENGRVTLKIKHGGQVSIKDKKGISHQYIHEIPNIVDYEYKKFNATEESSISRIDKRKIAYQNDREIYVDCITNSLGNDDIYIDLNPCTQWTVYISEEDNPGLKFEDITEVIFQFKARAFSMDLIER